MILHNSEKYGIWWQVELIGIDHRFGVIEIEKWCNNNLGQRFVNWRSPMRDRYWFKSKEDATLFELTWT